MAKQLNIAGARIGFKNFTGLEGAYNKEGERSFAVFLDDELAERLLEDGWNVKFPKPRELTSDEEDTRQPHLAVEVAFGKFPPKIVTITNDIPKVLSEEEVSTLDWLEIENVDLVINPYHWSVNGNSGVKAYLKAIYLTIESDMFSQKYGI